MIPVNFDRKQQESHRFPAEMTEFGSRNRAAGYAYFWPVLCGNGKNRSSDTNIVFLLSFFGRNRSVRLDLEDFSKGATGEKVGYYFLQ
jgi:hypothetical protein